MPAQFQQRLFDRRNRPAWAILATCLLLTAMAWYGLREQKMRAAAQQYELHSRDIVDAISMRMRQQEQILLGAAGLFDASHSVSRAEWHTYVSRLKLEQNYPGILGVGFSQLVYPAELEAHIASVRAEGFPEYELRPPGKRPLYTAIIYLEPFSGRNLAAFGYDMMSNATRAEAMKRAVEDNATALSGKVTLVQENKGKVQAGFLMYIPIYRAGMPLSNAGERWKALRGYVYSPYRMEDLMSGILGERSPWLDFSIHDGAGKNPEALMYDSVEASSAPLRTTPPRWSSTYTLTSYGHTWTIETHSRQAFEGSFDSPLDYTIPILGSASSLLLFILASFITFRRERAEELAQEMTGEIRRNEEKLRLSEARLAEGQRIARLGSWTLDLRSNHLEWSDQIFRIFEIDPEKFGASYGAFLNAIHPEDRDAVNQAYTGSVASRKPYEITHRLLMADGRIKYVTERGETEYAEDGSPRLSRGTMQDITMHHLAELELRKQERETQAILDNATVAIIATTPQGRITSFNRAAENMLGYRAAEMVGRETPAVFHDPAEVAARARQFGEELGIELAPGFDVFVEKSRRGLPNEYEWTYVRKDGGRFPVLLSVAAIRDESGDVTGYLGVAQDITERKRYEDAMRESAEHVQAIFDNVVDGIITIDEHGIIASFNRAAENIFGFSAGETTGKNVSMLMPQPYSDMHDSYLRNYLTTHIPRVIGIGREVEGRRADGSTFPMDLGVSEITHKGQRMFIGIVRDITERRKVERMKNEFVATVSHELRTPLTSIAGALGLLAGGAMGELPESVRSLVGIASKNSERLTHLINDLLDMEKIVAGKMDFDMRLQPLMPLVEQAMEATRSYGDQYRVRYVLSQRMDEIEVRVDARRLVQILSNFLSNAAKFSPEGSAVEVSVQRIGLRVRVDVCDHGPGIPEEFRQQIFRKFSQADASDTRAKGGTGLGLAISKELAERMGGSVGFESVPGQGATFFVELPINREVTEE